MSDEINIKLEEILSGIKLLGYKINRLKAKNKRQAEEITRLERSRDGLKTENKKLREELQRVSEELEELQYER